MRTFTLSLFAIVCSLIVNGQIWAPDGLRMPGDWNTFTNNNGMGGDFDLTQITTGTLRWTTTFQYSGTTGSKSFKFVSGDTDPWGNQWANSSFSINTLVTGIAWCTSCNPANNTISITNGNYYTVNWQDNGYAATNAIFMETSAMPVTLTKADQMPASGITPADSVFVGLKLSATPSAEEKFYVRYTTDGFATSSLKEVIVTADSGFTWIPAQSNGSTVNYYIFSTTVSNPTADFDMYTINLINNGGSNYSYSVFQAPKLFISEIADPSNDANARFVELFNNEDTAINLSSYTLETYFNANTSSTNTGLTGTIASKGTYLIASSTSTFSTVYGFSADQGGSVNSNGDDNFRLVDGNGNVIDMFGRIGEQGSSSTDHHFQDGRAERDSTVNMPSNTFLATQWNIVLNQNAPADFDPGSWYGFTPSVDTVAPAVVNVFADTTTEVTVVFDGPVDATTATNTANYTGVPGIQSATQNTIGDTIILTYSPALTRDDTLIISNVEDSASNVMKTDSVAFSVPLPIVAPKLFITELADPNNNSSARYVEIFNNEDTAIVLSNGWKLGRYTNDNTSPSPPISLSGTIASKGFFVIANNATNFASTYGFSPDQNGGTGGPADSNGDDQIYLEDPDGNVIDFFGRIGEDGSGTDHEFEDGRAERDSSVSTPNATFTASEWNIWNDNGGNGTVNDPQDAPGDFDPGSWIGYTPPVQPEPTNHVTNFAVDSNDFQKVYLSWDDAATGTQAPDGYLLVGKFGSGSYPTVADNAEVLDDTDFSDGDYAKNFVHTGSAQTHSISGLVDGQTYDFEIYAYTNSGTDIDYKTTTPPSVSTTLPSYPFDTVFYDGFDNCGNSSFITYDILGTTDQWTCGSGYYEMNGFGDEDDEDWLISPLLGFGSYDSLLLRFETNERYDGPDLEILVSTNYSGSGNPNLATWKNLSITFNDASSSGTYSGWFDYGFLDIDSLNGTDGYIAFKYTGTASNAENWQVDNFFISGNFQSDATPPIVSTAYVVSPTQINVVFDEAVSNTAETLGNYTGVSGLTSATRVTTLDTVELVFSSLPQGLNDTLIISNVQDTSGNTLAAPYSFAFFLNATTDSLVINEIMYNSASSDTLEFVELYNTSSNALPLGGLVLSDAFDFTFPSYSLPAGEFAVVALDTAAFSKVFTVTHLFEWTSGNLVNSSENIVLKNTLGQLVDSVTYDDGSPWDSRADGSGYSLVLCDPFTDNTDATNWSISTNNIDGITFASPGAANQCPIAITSSLAFTPTTSCQGDTITVNANAGGGSATLTYNWGPDANFVDDTQAAPQLILDNDTVEVYVEITDGFTTQFDTATFYAFPSYAITSSFAICEGDSVQLADGSYAKMAGTYIDTFTTTVNGCDSIITQQVTINPNPTISGSLGASPSMDGAFDGVTIWGQADATGDGIAGWAGANANDLYISQDSNYFYFAAAAVAPTWQSWAFLINTTNGGGTTDTWGRDVVYGHSNAPDFIFRGNYDINPTTGNYAEFHNWNGSAWNGVGTQASTADYGIGTDYVEVRVLKSTLGNPSSLQVQFFVSGDNNDHGTLDAIPDDEVDASWTGPTTTLDTYASLVANEVLLTDLCDNQGITFATAFPIGGTWSGNGFTNTTTGEYDPTGMGGMLDSIAYTFTDGNGCTSTAYDTISIFSTPNANAGGDQTICSADLPLTVVASGGTSYAWNDGSTNDSLSFSATTDSLLIVTVTDNGCSAIDSAFITVNTSPMSVTLNDDTICDGESVEFQIDPMGNTVTWSTASTEDSIIVSPNLTSSYWVEVSTPENCTAFDTAAVTVNALPTLSVTNNDTICTGTTVSYTATSNGSVNWSIGSNVANSGNITVSMDSTIYVTATSAENCSVIDSVMIKANVTPSVTISGNDTIVYGTVDTLVSSIVPSAGSYSYNWSPGSELVDSTLATVETNNLNSITTFNLEVTDNISGCSSTASYTTYISGGPLQINPVANPAAICVGDTTAISLNEQGGTGNYTFTWVPSTGLSDTSIANPMSYPSVTTKYYVTIDDGFNTATDSVTVTVNSIPTLTINGFDPSYCGATDGFAVASASNGATPYSYSWTNYGNNDTLSNLVAGTYYVAVSDANGCTTNDSITLTNPSPTKPMVMNMGGLSICAGDSSMLYVNSQLGVSGYQWSTDTGLISGSTDTAIWVANSGNFWVTINSNCGNVNSDTVGMTVNAIINVALADTICNGDSSFFNGMWYSASGVYVDSSLTGSGCDSITTFTITVNSLPTISFGSYSTPTIDGTFDGIANWNSPISSGDGNAGWAGVNASDLYLAEDSNNYYLAASATVQSWQAWAFLINTTAGGGTNDSWSRDIVYGHADAPDFIFRGNYNATANYAEFHNWNGTTWNGVGTQASTADYGIGTNYIEVRIPKASLGNPSSLDVQFFVTGDNNSHGTFDAIPDDEVDTSWTGPTTTLMNYATPNYSTASYTYCENNGAVILNASPMGGTWSGTGITNNSTGMYDPSIGGLMDTVMYTYTDMNGCTGIGNIYVQNNPISTGSDSTSICSGDSVFVGGAWQTMAGVYVDTLQNALGCDSILSTTVTILPSRFDTINEPICLGDSIFVGGAFRTAPGFYVDSFTTSLFCDSIVTTEVTLLQPDFVNTTENICLGDSAFLEGMWQTTSGVYIDSLINTYGCDSVVTTQLNIIQAKSTSLNVSICSGDSLFVGGAWQTTTGVYTDSLLGILGCDSIVTTNLNVSNFVTSNATATICSGDSIFLGGAYQFNSGSYSDTNQTSSGCDSIVVTQLFVNQPTIDSLAATICNGDSILLGGSFQNTAGWYVDSLQSVIGCDSVIYTNLSIQNAFADTVMASICSGDSILLGGNFQNTSGFYSDNYQTQFGCDSIVTTNLFVLPSPVTNDTITICNGDSALIAGMFRTTAGTYSETFAAANLCDSTVNTLLVINPLPSFDSVQVNMVSTCGATDGSISIFATSNGGALSYSIDGGNNFSTTNTLTNLSAAGYPVTIAENGCTVTDTTVVITAPGQTAAPTVSNDTAYCAGDSIAALSAVGANITWYNAPGLTSADSIGTGNNFLPTLNSGVNTFYATQNVGGCESPAAIVNVTLNSLPQVVASTNQLNTCVQSQFTLTASGATTYYWNDTIMGNQLMDMIAVAGTYTYTLKGEDANGCLGFDTVTVVVDTLPNVSFTDSLTVCEDADPFTLTGGMPMGGVYTSSNVVGDTLYVPNQVGLDLVNYTYTDSNGCANSAISQFEVLAKPAVSFGATSNFCANDNPTALTTGMPMGGFYDGVAIDTNGLFNTSLAVVGQNMVSYTYTDSNNCSNSAVQMVNVDSIPNVSFATIPNVCAQSGAFTLTQGMPMGGVYAGVGVSNDTLFNPTNSGTFSLTYTYTDGNGCSNAASRNIVVDTLPVADLGNITGICTGGTQAIVAPTGFANYAWSNGGATNQIIVNQLGTYTVTVTDANGCEGSDQVTLNQFFSLPNVSISPDDTTICAGDFAELTAGSWNSYAWSNASTSSTIKVSTPGTYSVTVTDLNGCSNNANTTVTLTDDPTLCGSIGLAEMDSKKMLNVYPNPAQNEVFISLINFSNEVNIRLVDLKGADYRNLNIEVTNNQPILLELNGIASGVYFIRIQDEVGVTMKRLVVR